MCGIVGYIGDKKASDIIIKGLKRLEYRGYDSAGLSTMENNNIFRVLCKTLLKANIITERTRKTYAEFVNMEELQAEDDEVAGIEIANEGLEILEEINKSRKVA